MEGAVVVSEERHGVRHHPDEATPTVEVRQRPVTVVIGDGGVGVKHGGLVVGLVEPPLDFTCNIAMFGFLLCCFI